jgi:hypothetical protein
VLPVPAVAGVAIPAGPVLRQVGEDRVAIGRLAPPEPALLPQPDQVGERERRLGREPVLERGFAAGDVQVPAESAAVIDQPRPGTGVVQQVVDELRDARGAARLPHRAQPGTQRPHRREIRGGRGGPRGDLVLVEEHLEGIDVPQVRRVHQVRVNQVGREHQGGGRVMSEKHVDS